jgi:nitrate reductase gamma subunit
MNHKKTLLLLPLFLLVGWHQSEASWLIDRAAFHMSAHGQTSCQDCHEDVSDRDIHPNPTHAGMDCTACHSDALEFEHHRQKRIECRACHLPHDEKVAHDAHASVSCEACHLQGITPVRDPETRRILWTWERDLNHESRIHQMAWPGGDKGQCRRCHYSDNPLVAPSAVLPPKSVTCMPCHAATLSLSDPLSIIGVVILLCGLLLPVSFWLTAALPRDTRNKGVTKKISNPSVRSVTTPFTRKMISVISILFFDVLLLSRLYGRSKFRWFAHGLIFYPCLLRLLWGWVVLFCSQLVPQWSPLWIMMDKNHPLTAAFFDISGVLILVGIILAFVRGRLNRPNLKGIPSQDLIALSLLAAIVIAGFVLEGMRMAMAGLTESGSHALIGYFVSTLFSNPSRLIDVYGNVWYAHAAFTAAFIGYLPFSRLRHMIMAPLILAVGSVTTSRGGKKTRPRVQKKHE